MNGDDHHDVESRLRADADRLLVCDRSPSVEDLLTKHRRRLARQRFGAGAAAVLAVVVGVALLQIPSPRNEASLANNSHQEESKQAATSIETSPELVVRHLDHSEWGDADSVPVPVLLVGRNTDGTNLVMPGLYVPHRSEPVDVDRLTAVQRRAIRQVLGIRKPLASKQSI